MAVSKVLMEEFIESIQYRPTGTQNQIACYSAVWNKRKAAWLRLLVRECVPAIPYAIPLRFDTVNHFIILVFQHDNILKMWNCFYSYTCATEH